MSSHFWKGNVFFLLQLVTKYRSCKGCIFYIFYLCLQKIPNTVIFVTAVGTPKSTAKYVLGITTNARVDTFPSTKSWESRPPHASRFWATLSVNSLDPRSSGYYCKNTIYWYCQPIRYQLIQCLPMFHNKMYDPNDIKCRSLVKEILVIWCYQLLRKITAIYWETV